MKDYFPSTNLLKNWSLHVKVLLAARKGIVDLVHAQYFWKKPIILCPLRMRTCAYQGVRNISFSEYFALVLNGWSLEQLSESYQFYWYATDFSDLFG